MPQVANSEIVETVAVSRSVRCVVALGADGGTREFSGPELGTTCPESSRNRKAARCYRRHDDFVCDNQVKLRNILERYSVMACFTDHTSAG